MTNTALIILAAGQSACLGHLNDVAKVDFTGGEVDIDTPEDYNLHQKSVRQKSNP